MPVSLSSISTSKPATTTGIIFDGVSTSGSVTINKTGLSIPAGTHTFQSSGYGTIQIGSYPTQAFVPNSPIYVPVPSAQTTATVTLTKSARGTATVRSTGTNQVTSSRSEEHTSELQSH